MHILTLFVIGKIGYGTASEVLACKLPLVFVRRDYFNEEPFLQNLLEVETFLIIELC
jgi:UDP-N-acetylglucosamine:LPS N-acetylglucosamine transferase